MSLSLQSVPEQHNAAAMAALARSSLSTSGHGGPPTGVPIGGFEAQLAGDSSTKAKLHRLVLVLPLAVLIFGEALRFPSAEIELPIIKLKLQVAKVLPIFLLLLSYMLHRAMRYARIVLWNTMYSPEQLTEIARISLDDTEAYKMNSAFYEEVLDPMAALLINWKRTWPRLVARISFVTFNLVVALVAYGAIFLMLSVMTYYASMSAIDLASKWHVLQFRPQWPIMAERTIDILVLCLSTFLLCLTCLNAAWIVITPALVVIAIILGVILSCIGFLWKAVRVGSPVKFILSAIHDGASRLREQHRDRVLAREMESYEERRSAPDDQRVAEYRTRYRLFSYATELRAQIFALERQYGLGIFDGGEIAGVENSEWSKVTSQYGFGELAFCAAFIEISAHRAPMDFVIWKAPRLARQVQAAMDGYALPANEALQELIARSKSLTADERESAVEMVRARCANMTSQVTQIKTLRERWERALSKAVTGRSRFKSRLDKYKMRDAAVEYFKQSEYWQTTFSERVPERGARDWKTVTRILTWLEQVSAV